MLVKASLSDIRRSVSNASGLGLIFQGVKYDTAIWGVGNCLVVARKEAELFAHVILHRFRQTPPDDEAVAAWNHLCARWEEMEWVANAEYVDSIENFADWALDIQARAKLPMPNEAEWKAQWIKEHYNVLRPLADSDDALAREADAQWRTVREFIEGLKNEAKAREAVASKTAEEAANEFWEWIRVNQPAEPSVGDEQRSDKQTRKRGANDDTPIKIEKLRAYRLQELKRTGKIPNRELSCGSIEPTITAKTVRKHAPELWAKWYDKEYR